MRWGTSYFASVRAANTYYKRQEGATPDHVQRKLDEGLINVGYPPTKPGERAHMDPEGRYFITTKD